jgi:phage shock protein C
MDTRLVRSNNDRVFAGVCGGLARYFGIDSAIVRLVFVLAVVFGGISPLIYVVLWIVMPQENPSTPPPALTQQDPTGEWEYDPYTGERIQKP